ncbi:hypothetical protein GOB86_09535 [Acetobacter lambici]|uniref:DUF2570 domain-containing protein n=1 Tax=Acetobacter lambici TaxID=1332824 RepID=A0ABT1F1C3_9PROT|nr:hypothetical protein [Acetobacter lambici]MCP1242851.1 hypothetical protein [Acetobacter lambici]MCP1258990.1 hypothetical protein [Acetobacter lambici]NHO57297.1 hypothetical protein [Acetobacter lambici]
MAAILLPILEKFGKWIAIIGVIVGLFLWGRHYQLDSRQKETELAQSQQTITQMKSDYAKYQEQQTALLKQEQSRQAKTITIVKSIANAKETNSCASSPAIRNVLNGLRDHNSTASPTDNSLKHASLSGSSTSTK